jgi:LEA14-like dessication related protein
MTHLFVLVCRLQRERLFTTKCLFTFGLNKGGCMRKAVFLLIAAICCLSLGCSEFAKRMAVKELDFSLERVSLDEYDMTYMTLNVEVKADNPNDIDAVIDRLDYSFSINDNSVASGTTARKVTVEANKMKNISTKMKINYMKLGAAILDAVKNKTADFRMEGTVYVDTPLGAITFPIDLLYP